MPESVFDDKATHPDDVDVSGVLGDRVELWQKLLAAPGMECDVTEAQWSFYNKRSGWILLIKHKKHTICTLLPKADEFVVVFLFPERAVEAARAANLPAAIMTSIDEAKAYKSGRPFNVSVTDEADLAAVQKLVAIKAASWKRPK